MNLVYNISNGDVLSIIPTDQLPRKYPDGVEVGVLSIDNCHIDNIKFYKVVDGNLIKRSQLEIEDIIKYGRILTDADRVSILLKPSKEEIIKAKSILETLSILKEVGLA